MDNIQFGDIQEVQLEPELRPDRNAHFATRVIGQLPADELPIFVDLDVMRDMEAHATSDTNVELGGVMLGHQRVDADGQPFVVVTESLRAEHYRATKGTFKFTHETWSEINRRQAEFHPNLQMIGWYHTHPGWNVFLSGMDLFICNHFFNRTLDVALVIDPVNDDRGWFQWPDGDPPRSQPMRTGGFILTTGRHRQDELDYFANLYENKRMNHDPRYSPGNSRQTIQLVDSNKGTDWVLPAIVLLQALLITVVAYALISSSHNQATSLAPQRKSIRQQAQAELLSMVVAGQTGQQNLAAEFTELKEQEYLLRKNLEGQLAIAESESSIRRQVENQLQETVVTKQRYADELRRTKNALKSAQQRLADFDQAAAQGTINASPAPTSWPMWLAGAIAILAIGAAAGYVWRAWPASNRQRLADDADGLPDQDLHSVDIDRDDPPSVQYQDPVTTTKVG